MAITIVLISKPSHFISRHIPHIHGYFWNWGFRTRRIYFFQCLFKYRRYSVWTQMLQYPNIYSEFLFANDANVRRGCGCLRHLYRNFRFCQSRIKNLKKFLNIFNQEELLPKGRLCVPKTKMQRKSFVLKNTGVDVERAEDSNERLEQRTFGHFAWKINKMINGWSELLPTGQEARPRICDEDWHDIM